MSEMTPACRALCDELFEWLRIPSVSADPERAGDVRAAAQWVVDFVRGAGGTAELLPEQSNLVVGEIPASADPERAPVVMVYGHVDVQPAGPLELWDSPPFEPVVRDGWIRARGAADDKGNLYVLLKAAAQLAAEGALPVNVRVLVDADEEVGGTAVCDALAADARGADACIVFDTAMMGRDRPFVCLGSRGNLCFEITARTGERDLHSGMYGAAAANAVHALMRALSTVVDVPAELRAGAVEPTPEELDEWRRASLDVDLLRNGGAVALPGVTTENALERVFSTTSVDVTGIVGGEPGLPKTVLPVWARAFASVRLAPGQRLEVVEAAFRRLVLAAAPAGAEVEVRTLFRIEPSLTRPDAPAVRIAREVLAEVLGGPVALLRTGGSLPVLAALAARGIPSVLSGLAVPESNIHGPNEGLLLRYLDGGVELARRLLVAFQELPRR